MFSSVGIEPQSSRLAGQLLNRYTTAWTRMLLVVDYMYIYIVFKRFWKIFERFCKD